MASPIPAGYHTLTPYLVLKDSAAAMEFYKKAFGAEERGRISAPGSSAVMHAEMKIGDSIFMLSDECPQNEVKSPQGVGATTVSIYIYVNDVDKAFAQAKAAGATVKMPPADMFWGDRFCSIVDPFGHLWSIATHKSDPTPEQMQKGMIEFTEQMKKQGK